MDNTESTRREMVQEINNNAKVREELEAKVGKVWSTAEMSQDFEVVGFMAPFVVVKEKATGKKGSLEFQHSPRLYYSFTEDK